MKQLTTVIFSLAVFLLTACGDSSSEQAKEEPIPDPPVVVPPTPPVIVPDPEPDFCANQATVSEHSFDAEYPASDPESTPQETLLTEFVVKETSGFGVTNYPISMVFPLPYGQYFYGSDFHIKNSQGEVVPAQFNVLNRWWAKDKSLRHVQAHFNVNVAAYQLAQSGSGRQKFFLYAGAENVIPTNAVCITEDDNGVNIDNGLVAITLEKAPFVISTPAGKLSSNFINEQGELDRSFNHEDIQIELEEVGFQRTVVKVSSLTRYDSPTSIKHGWALRLYVYANSPLVKVDFQLQNSAINTIYSAPLYFKSHELVLDNIGTVGDVEKIAQQINKQEIESGSAGFITGENANVFFRNFWQTFPNGLKTVAQGKLHIELWPSWSKQFLNSDYTSGDFYWLDDMKHSYKEVMFDFSKGDEIASLQSIAKNFQHPPVAVLPQHYYQQSKATLNLGGYFPISDIPTELSRLPQYQGADFTEVFFGAAKFGQDNFAIDLYRKTRTGNGGGWAYSNRQFFVSGNPKDYYFAQDMAKAEINIRPQWLAGYTHQEHFEQLKPSTNPYGGDTWRKFVNNQSPTLMRDYIEGSQQVANPRDDQHAWFYHIEQAYLMSGNKWLKDWFEFMAQFKQVYLQELDPWPDRSNRGEGQAVNIALAAYRVTGDSGLGNLLSSYTTNIHSKYLLAPHNISIGRLDRETPRAAVFQQGYLVKSFIDIYNEFPNQEVTLTLIKNYVDWNFAYSNFNYYRSVIDYQVTQSASGSSMTFVDAAIWYSLYSKENKYAEHAITFVQQGIGGVRAYGNWGPWLGQYEGQLYNYYLQNIQ